MNPSHLTMTQNDNNQKTLLAWRDRCNQKLLDSLETCREFPEKLRAAMQYSLLIGGKRLRPLLVYATGYSLGAPLSALDQAAVAVEYIHTYSLIHDDLPAMDDDDLRRGQASCHKAFDEATAILAGDALQCQAFAILNQPHPALSDTQRARLIQLLAEGGIGMVSGQILDLAAEGQQLSMAELENIHALKTGRLITASILMGAAMSSHADEKIIAQLTQFGEKIGLAFQIKDDILDVTGTSADLGKPTGSDNALNKSTYVKYLGLEDAEKYCQELLLEALTLLKNLAHPLPLLALVATQLVERDC